MLLTISEFIGHLHPILVHLPIGILLLAVCFQFLSYKEKYSALGTAVGVSLFLGMIGAVASCISGFLLSQTGDYNSGLVNNHQWFGITTAVVSILAYYFYARQKLFLKWILLLLALLIIITGHLGGSLTHGEGYVTNSFNTDTNNTVLQKPIANVQEAVLYSDVIQPILQSKCYNCHGANKQKGKLRLDEPDFITKGGKNGTVAVWGKTEESELIKRILLPVENDNHMPPDKKPQLQQQDIALLNWWVSSGAAFNKKIKDLPQNEKIKQVLSALQSGVVTKENKIIDIPAAPVEKAADADVAKLKMLGVVVIPVAQNSNYLSANFITANFTDKDLQLLLPLQKQLLWLKLGNTKITDAGLPAIAALTNLNKLYLENTAVTDKGIAQLNTLLQLQYLNITGTAVSTNGLIQLKNLQNLQQLYLFNTKVAATNYTDIKKIFANTVIDTGGYKTTMLPTDTMLVKPPAIKK